MKVYISGPISSAPSIDHAIKSFSLATALLRTEGFGVINPLEEELKIGPITPCQPGSEAWVAHMKRDIALLMECDAIHMLDGWEASEGAKLERHLALTLRLPLVDIDGMIIKSPPTEQADDILEEASYLVNGPRNADYGPAWKDYTRTGMMWGALIDCPRCKMPVGQIPPERALLCMSTMKFSRECNRHKKDNLVDAIGYIACVWKTIRARAAGLLERVWSESEVK